MTRNAPASRTILYIRIAGQMMRIMLSELHAPLAALTRICSGCAPNADRAITASTATETTAARPTLHLQPTSRIISSSTGAAASKHNRMGLSSMVFSVPCANSMTQQVPAPLGKPMPAGRIFFLRGVIADRAPLQKRPSLPRTWQAALWRSLRQSCRRRGACRQWRY